MLKTIRELIWKIYKGFCFFVGTLVLIYPFLLGLMYFSKRFDRTYLPNGVYIAKESAFSHIPDIFLWRADGTPILKGDIGFICFNKNYIYATNNLGPNFIYVVNKDKVVFSDAPEYDDIYRVSNLFNSLDNGCIGHFDSLVSVDLLLNKPWVLKKGLPDSEKKCGPTFSKEDEDDYPLLSVNDR